MVKSIKIVKKGIEKYVAWGFKALFWRNGGSFKTPRENIVRPKDIDNIDESIKILIDKLILEYNNQEIK